MILISSGGEFIDWNNASAVRITADYKTMLQESSNIRFLPVYGIECDGKASEYSFHTVMRWENRSLVKGKMIARAAMAGLSISNSKSGSWPFIDLQLKKGKDDEPAMKITDQAMILHSRVIIPGFREASYKFTVNNGKTGSIRCIGRDTLQTRAETGENNSSHKISEGAVLHSRLTGSVINFIQYLLPSSVKKAMPADISDFIPIKYDFFLPRH